MIAASGATSSVWNGINERQRARTLAASHFVDFPDDPADTDWRRRTSEAIRLGSTLAKEKLASWRSFVAQIAGPIDSPKLLFARLQSRLMVNMAGGVFENGGLCLDRLSGVPYIPGSAIKGCARRMAVNELLALNENGAASETGLQEAVEILMQICFVFGWGDTEWKEGKNKKNEYHSDFEFACGERWKEIRKLTALRICERLSIEPKDRDEPWNSLPDFAGKILFLPAFPWERDPGIELDIITGHHDKYYAKTEDKRGRVMPVALDVEDPVPIIFPAVSAAAFPVFAFLLDHDPNADRGLLHIAKAWLGNGLETFGIGAKTSAGYGWFMEDKHFGAEEIAKFENEAAARQREQAKATEQAKTEQKKVEAKERERRLEGLPPEERDDARVADLNDDQFQEWLRRFIRKKGGLSDSEKSAVVRALRGPRLELWGALKKRAAAGGEFATIEQAIRALNKALHSDKMP